MGARVLAHLGNRKASNITSDEIEALRDRLLDGDEANDIPGLAGGSVTWTLARLSKVYNFGLKKKIIDGVNPVTGVEHPEVAVSIDFLSKGEVTSLLDYLHKPEADLEGRMVPGLYAMVATAIYAGLRKGELFGLRWGDISIDRMQITLARSYTLLPKSGKPRHVPIHPTLARILREWEQRCPATAERLVFPYHNPVTGWEMGQRNDMLHLPHYLAAAGCHVPTKPWHALRHTFASHFMMAGGSILTLQRLLGHASIEQTMAYSHLAPDFMAAEVARMTFPTAEVVDLDEERRRRAASGEPVDTSSHATDEKAAFTAS
jgi:integrase